MNDEELEALLRPPTDGFDGALDPRLAKLAAGSITDAERAELEALAEDDLALALALEAFSPFDDDFEDEIVAMGLESLPDVAGPLPVPANRRWGPWLALLVVAAAWLFILLPEAGPPPYTLTLQGIPSVERAPEGARAPLPAQGTLTLLLRPATATSAEPDLHIVVVRGASRRTLSVNPRRARGGMVQVAIPASDLGPAGGLDLEVHLGEQTFVRHLEVAGP